MMHLLAASIFAAIGLFAALWNNARRGRWPVPTLQAAAAGAGAIAIGSPGAGVVDWLLRLPFGHAGSAVPPFLPHACAALLTIWATTRFIPAAVEIHAGDQRADQSERISRTITSVSAAVIGALYLMSLRPGAEASSWDAIIIFTWSVSMMVSLRCLWVTTDYVRELWDAKAWHVFAHFIGVYLFASAATFCVVDPSSTRLQGTALAALGLMLLGAAYARGYESRVEENQ